MQPYCRLEATLGYAAAEQIISFSKGAELLNKSPAEFEREVRIVS